MAGILMRFRAARCNILEPCVRALCTSRRHPRAGGDPEARAAIATNGCATLHGSSPVRTRDAARRGLFRSRARSRTRYRTRIPYSFSLDRERRGQQLSRRRRSRVVSIVVAKQIVAVVPHGDERRDGLLRRRGIALQDRRFQLHGFGQ